MPGKRTSSVLGEADISGSRTKSKSKKARLSGASGEQDAGSSASGSKVTLRIDDTDPNWSIGAALVTSTDFETPDIPYTLSVAPTRPSARLPNAHSLRGIDTATDGSKQAHLSNRLILYGQSGPMYYTSTNWESGGTDLIGGRVRPNPRRMYAGDYLIGVRDPATSVVTLRPVPLYTITRRVIALADHSGPDAASASDTDYQKRFQARRDLGDEFGNRKTKAKAQQYDRMKVTVAEGERDVENTMSLVAQGIADATVGMQDEEAVKATADAQRPIPQLNVEAVHPSEAYTLDALIPPTVQGLLKSAVRYFYAPPPSDLDIEDSLPTGPQQPGYLWMRLLQAAHQSRPGGVAGSSEDARRRLLMAYYAILLWAFKRIAGGREVGDRQELLKRLNLSDVAGGEQILDHLITTFTEGMRGSTKYKMTPFSEQKLMSYFLALALHLDGFTVDHNALAADLNMSPPKIAEYMKSLGCVSSTSSAAVTPTGGKGRVMVLACPITLPAPRRGMTKR